MWLGAVRPVLPHEQRDIAAQNVRKYVLLTVISPCGEGNLIEQGMVKSISGSVGLSKSVKREENVKNTSTDTLPSLYVEQKQACKISAVLIFHTAEIFLCSGISWTLLKELNKAAGIAIGLR